MWRGPYIQSQVRWIGSEATACQQRTCSNNCGVCSIGPGWIDTNSMQVHDRESQSTIVLATSRIDPQPTISIWRYGHSSAQDKERRLMKKELAIVQAFDWTLQITLWILMLGVFLILFLDVWVRLCMHQEVAYG